MLIQKMNNPWAQQWCWWWKAFCDLGLRDIKEHLPNHDEVLRQPTDKCSNTSDKEDFFSRTKHEHTQETAGFISGVHSWKSGHFDTLPSGIQPVAQVKHSTAHFCCLPKTLKCSRTDVQPTKGKDWFIQLRKSSSYLSWIRTFSSLNSSIRLLILTTRDMFHIIWRVEYNPQCRWKVFQTNCAH